MPKRPVGASGSTGAEQFDMKMRQAAGERDTVIRYVLPIDQVYQEEEYMRMRHSMQFVRLKCA